MVWSTGKAASAVHHRLCLFQGFCSFVLAGSNKGRSLDSEQPAEQEYESCSRNNVHKKRTSLLLGEALLECLTSPATSALILHASSVALHCGQAPSR